MEPVCDSRAYFAPVDSALRAVFIMTTSPWPKPIKGGLVDSEGTCVTPFCRFSTGRRSIARGGSQIVIELTPGPPMNGFVVRLRRVGHFPEHLARHAQPRHPNYGTNQ